VSRQGNASPSEAGRSIGFPACRSEKGHYEDDEARTRVHKRLGLAIS